MLIPVDHYKSLLLDDPLGRNAVSVPFLVLEVQRYVLRIVPQASRRVHFVTIPLNDFVRKGDLLSML